MSSTSSLFEEKEQCSLSASSPPRAQSSAASPSSSSPPHSPSSPPSASASSSSPSISALLRSAQSLCASLRQHRPALLDSASSRYLHSSALLLSQLSDELRCGLQATSTARSAQTAELRAVVGEQQRLLDALKEEQHRRRRAERLLAAQQRGKAAAALSDKERQEGGRRRAEELDAELCGLRRRHELMVDDWRAERLLMEERAKAEQAKRVRLSAALKSSRAKAAESSLLVEQLQAELAQLQHRLQVDAKERAELLEERLFLTQNRADVQDANIRLLASVEQAHLQAEQLSEAKRGWEEEQRQWRLREDDWMAQAEELRRLREQQADVARRSAAVDAQAQALAALTVRMQEKTEAMHADYAGHCARGREDMREEMWTAVRAAEKAADEWRTKAEETQHRSDLQQMELTRTQLAAREAALQAEQDRGEGERRKGKEARLVEQLEEEVRLARGREAEGEERARQALAQLRLLTDANTSDELQRRAEAQASAAAMEEVRGEAARLKEAGAEATAELQRLQQRLAAEAERVRLLSGELDGLRLLHATFIDPVLHRSAQLELTAARAEVASLQRKVSEHSAAASSLQLSVDRAEEALERRMAEAVAGRRELEGQLRTLLDDQRRGEVRAKELQLDAAQQLSDATARAAKAEGQLEAAVEEAERCRRAAAAAEELRLSSKRDCDARLLSLQSNLRQRSRHCQQLLHQQAEAHTQQAKDWEADIADKAQQLAEQQTTAEQLHTRTAQLQEKATAAEQAAAHASAKQAESERELALVEQEALAVQAQHAKAAHALSEERRLREEQRRKAEVEREAGHARLSSLQASLDAAQSQLQRAEHDGHAAHRDAVELRAAVDKVDQRMVELRQRLTEAEDGRAAAAQRAVQAEAELQPLKEVGKDCEARLLSFTCQLRAQQDELTVQQRLSAEKLQAMDAALLERESWVKEERERRGEAEKESARQREGWLREADKAAALRGELDQLRLLHSSFVSPDLHLEQRQRLQRAEVELARLQRAEADWTSRAAELQAKVAALQTEEAALRSATAAAHAALHAQLRAALAERCGLELQLRELQVGFAAQQSELEDEADQQAAALSTTRTQLAAAVQEAAQLSAEQAAQRVQAEGELAELRRELRQQEASYQLLIQRQQAAQEEALTAWELQLSLRAREVEQLTRDLHAAEGHTRAEKQKTAEAETELREKQAELRAVQGEKLQQQRDGVEAHGRQLRALQLRVDREQEMEAQERELQLLLQSQRASEQRLELLVSQLSATLRETELRCDAELHEQALQLADYSALVSRMAEQLRAVQAEKERMRADMKDTLDCLLDDMREEAANSQQRLSRLHGSVASGDGTAASPLGDEWKAEVEAVRTAAAGQLAVQRAHSALLASNVDGLHSSLSTLAAQLQAERSTRAVTESALLSPRVAVHVTSPPPRVVGVSDAARERLRSVAVRLRLQVERLSAELVAEKEWHASTKRSMEAFQRRIRTHAARADALQLGSEEQEEEEEEKRTEREEDGVRASAGAAVSLDAALLHAEVSELRAALQSNEQQRLAAAREAELQSASAAQQRTDSAAVVAQLTQRIAQLEGQRRQPSLATTLLLSSSPHSSPLSMRPFPSPRASPHRLDRAKRPAWGASEGELHGQRGEWKEEKEAEGARPTLCLPSSSSAILQVHALHSIEPTHPSLVQSSLFASAKSRRRWSSSLRSPLSPTLPSVDAREDVIHLRSELRLAAVELEELQRQKAEAELDWARREEQHREEQRQWRRLLDQAATLNHQLQQRLSSAQPQPHHADDDADAGTGKQSRVEAASHVDDGAMDEEEDDDGGLVTIEIEERLHLPSPLSTPPAGAAASGERVASGPHVMLSGHSAGGASTLSGGRNARVGSNGSAAVGRADNRKQRGGGAEGGRGPAERRGGGGGGGGGDDDGEDDERPPRRLASSASPHYSDSPPTKSAEWSKAADSPSPFASRSSSPRLSAAALERGGAGAVGSSSPSPSSSSSSLLRINEELSARLSSLEAEHARLQRERERLLSSQEEEMERHRVETAEAVAEQQTQVRRLTEQLNRSGRRAEESGDSLEPPMSAEQRQQSRGRRVPEGRQSRRVAALSSSGARSTPSSRLTSPRQALESASLPFLSVSSSLQSTVDSLASTCREQAQELQQLRAQLAASRRAHGELQQRQLHTAAAAATAAMSPSRLAGAAGVVHPSSSLPSFAADSRLLLSLQTSEAERLLQEGRLDAALLRVQQLEDERQRLEAEMEEAAHSRRAAEDELDDARSRHAAERAGSLQSSEQAAAALSSSLAELRACELRVREVESLLELQSKETEEWKAMAEERERELAALVQREEESVDVMRHMDVELRKAEEALAVREEQTRQLQAALDDSQHHAAALKARQAQAEAEQAKTQRREEEQQRRSAEEAERLETQLRLQASQSAELRGQRDGLQAKVAQLSAAGEAERLSQELLQEALQAQAEALECMLLERKEEEEDDSRDRHEERLQGELELQARSIEALLVRQQEANEAIRAIGHEVDDGRSAEREQTTQRTAGEEEEQEEGQDTAAEVEEEEAKVVEPTWTVTGRGGAAPPPSAPVESTSPSSSPTSPSSSLFPTNPVELPEDRVSAARDTLRRMRLLHEQRQARR